MSYRCNISFKKINGEDVFDFCSKLKEEALNHFEDIAEHAYIYSPRWRSPDVTQKEWETWVKDLFCYRVTYCKELGMLGVYEVPLCMKHLFDGTVYFQNSCDRDYERDEYDGIKEFEEIYDKYDKMSADDINQKCKESTGESIVQRFDISEEDYNSEMDYWVGYVSRTLAYDEIWSYFEESLWDEKSVVFIRLFNSVYEIKEINNFIKLVKKKVEDFEKLERKETQRLEEGSKET